MFSWMFPRFDTGRYDVKLVGLRQSDHACENLKQQGIDITSLNKGKFDFSTIWEIIRMVKKEKADIVHLHGYGSSNFGRIAAKITGIKTVVHEHLAFPRVPQYQAFFDYFLSSYADWSIACSHSVKDFMANKRFIPKEQIDVVYYGTSLDDFKPSNGQMVRTERMKWKVPEGFTILGYIGRIDEQKGIPYLLDAAEILLRKGYEKIRLMIIGDGPKLDELKRQVDKNGLGDHVIFTGHCSNIPLIQSIIDIQVFPSLWEGTPLALFEAMSMRRPIVSTNVDGLGEILRHEDTALLVSPRDSEGLALAIEELIMDSQKAERLASRAQEESQNFDCQRMVEQIQGVYEKLMN